MTMKCEECFRPIKPNMVGYSCGYFYVCKTCYKEALEAWKEFKATNDYKFELKNGIQTTTEFTCNFKNQKKRCRINDSLVSLGAYIEDQIICIKHDKNWENNEYLVGLVSGYDDIKNRLKKIWF